MSNSHGERFSGHESFVCRYGWLPKVFKAVNTDAGVLRNEERAMSVLGIGRNMVKSIQFWAEASGILRLAESAGHSAGPIGATLFGPDAWDLYLESLESLWLIHWWLCTKAGLAAWNIVFGEGQIIRFERQNLVAALAQRGRGFARPLAVGTLEQHASIFIQSYYQAERGADDTSWCPLQDLGLIKATKNENGGNLYSTDAVAPVGLSPRVFGVALIAFLAQQGNGTWTADLHSVLKGEYSPGIIFRLDEYQLRQFIESAISGPFEASLRFVDTADTQSVVLDPDRLEPQYRHWVQQEALKYA